MANKEEGVKMQCRGKWGSADKEEVDKLLAVGKPHCYRFRVPKNETVTIKDTIRGEVTWNTDTLGDFVVLRSNGLPVYNFCVAVDDGMMNISHVIRAEEHLPNTLRQVRPACCPATPAGQHWADQVYDCVYLPTTATLACIVPFSQHDTADGLCHHQLAASGKHVVHIQKTPACCSCVFRGLTNLHVDVTRC